MKYILSHPRLTKSAFPLARKISELVREEIKVFTLSNLNHELIIRYGNSGHAGAVDCKFNESNHIRLAGNKLRLSNFLSGNDGEEEKLPNLTLFNRNYIEEEEFPIVVRTELNRGGGIGIVVCENMEQFIPYRNNVWSHWYDFQFELGVHILGGEIARVFKKIREGGLEEEKFPIKNTQRGYKFSLRKDWERIYGGLEEFVGKLYKLIPIQFARLDIGYDKKTGGYRLIEINSAPDLSQNVNTLNMYAEFLTKSIF